MGGIKKMIATNSTKEHENMLFNLVLLRQLTNSCPNVLIGHPHPLIPAFAGMTI
jgi:hypothetical protein